MSGVRRCRLVRLTACSGQAVWPFRSEKDHFEVIKSACRICHSLEDHRDDPLVAPCRCDGSLRYVHNTCQQAWLSHRRGPVDFTCELCRSSLACRLTMATRLQLIFVFFASVLLWSAQLGSTWQGMQLAGKLLLAGWRNVGRVSHLLAQPPGFLDFCQNFAQCAKQRTVISLGTLVLALNFFRSRRPIFLGEEFMVKVCTVKIGGCVLVLLHEIIWVFPAVKKMAPLYAWSALGHTLLMDTMILAFLRVPREEQCGRQALCRILQAAVSLTGDFLPFAAVFFLWLASIGMVVAASLVPCMALLLHEAVRDLRRRRQQHGTVQMAVFILCLAVRVMSFLAANVSKGQGDALAVWMERGSLTLWLAVEAVVFVDFAIFRGGLSCARDGTSQVLWTMACLGQVVLVVCSHLHAALPGMLQAEGCRSRVFTPFHRRQGHESMMCQFQLLAGNCRGDPGTAAVQVTALSLMLLSFWSIHASVFCGWFRRLKQALTQALAHIEPSQVTFFDHPCHKAPYLPSTMPTTPR